eukprot:10542613-Lingulodinium_polyedra.AAC.1
MTNPWPNHDQPMTKTLSSSGAETSAQKSAGKGVGQRGGNSAGKRRQHGPPRRRRNECLPVA